MIKDKYSQVESVIEKMREELENTVQNYIGVDAKTPEMRLGFMKGRGSAFFEAMAVISVLQAEIKWLRDELLRTQKFADNLLKNN